jgi:hypothetical protein
MLPKLWILLPRGGGVVEERSVSRRRCSVRDAGGIRNENAGISSDNEGEKPSHRKSKVSWARLVLPG